MIANLFHHLRLAATGLTLALVAHGAAHAGFVRGDWDPVFGGPLTNLSWQVRSEWLVPNGCSASADGVYSTSALGGPCENTFSDPVRLLSLWLRWFDTDTGDAGDFFQFVNPISSYAGYCESTWALSQPDCFLNPPQTTLFTLGSEPLSALNVRVAANQIVGFDTGPTPTSFLTFGWPTSAGTQQYDLSFTTNGPVLTCVDQIESESGVCDPSVTADNTDLRQFLVTFTSNDASVPKFTNSDGVALGAVLDGQGNYLGQAAVPEPGTLALALAALTAVGWSRRRRV